MDVKLYLFTLYKIQNMHQVRVYHTGLPPLALVTSNIARALLWCLVLSHLTSQFKAAVLVTDGRNDEN